MEKPSIDPNDVAAATAVGAATRLGTSRRRAKRGAEDVGAAAGVDGTSPAKRKRGGSLWLAALLFVLGIVAMLALMLYLGD